MINSDEKSFDGGRGTPPSANRGGGDDITTPHTKSDQNITLSNSIQFYVDRCEAASKKFGLGEDAAISMMMTNWNFLLANDLDPNVYTGLCING